MNFKRYHVSKNLFDILSVTHQTLGTDGSITYESGMNLSDFIKVNGDYTISWRAVQSGAYMRVSTFDDNKNFIERVTATNAYTNTHYSNSHSGYIRINYENGYGLSEVMLNTGSAPQPYEPYSLEVWHETPHYIMGTSTDTITTLPADIYANDTTATVGLKGQMEQSGTPTPTSPIQPSECGNKTANLYLKKITGGSIDVNGVITGNASFDSYVAKVEANQQYIGSGYVYAFYTNEPTLGSASYNGQRVVASATNGFTSPIDGYVAVRHNSGVTNAMLNTGSIALDYEPYGYKIPILTNSQATNVYLGEVQTTRKIKKLVLTGQETWTYESDRTRFYTSISDVLIGQARSIPIMSTHFTGVYDGRSESQVGNNSIYVAANTNLYIKTTNYNTETAFTEFLQQQYAAGTPVCVWYVLATPTTGIVNEPLRKIGDYADEVSGITIPTTAGANAIDVLTTLKPSEVSVNYHGWHPISAVHERENGAWT